VMGLDTARQGGIRCVQMGITPEERVMTTISLKVPSALRRRLAQVAQQRQTSRSAVIRDALEQFVEGNAGRGDSCLAIAAELIGCADGPADLSYNKKRLAGFGK